MGRLNFKREFHEAIRRGGKTTTLRHWARCRVKTGDRVLAPGVGWLLVTSVSQVEFHKLTEADAVADGFASLRQLSAAIKRIYPDHQHDGKAWFRIGFVLAEPIVQPEDPGLFAIVDRPAPRPAQRRRPVRGPKLGPGEKAHLARIVRAELDKAVRRTGSSRHL